MSDIAKAWTALVFANIVLLILGVWVFSSQSARFSVAAVGVAYSVATIVRIRGMHRGQVSRS